MGALMRLVALIDGPLPPAHPALAGREDVIEGANADSPAGRHAAAMAAAILATAPATRIIGLAVFVGQLTTSAAALAAALERAAASEARIVHCSLGLPRPDEAVARAVAQLVAAGRIIVASAPARGGPVWPAALPEVFSVQGDARCGPGQWSLLDLPTARYGASPRHDAKPEIAGASMAAAHLTGIIAASPWRDIADARAALDTKAAFRGRERRG